MAYAFGHLMAAWIVGLLIQRKKKLSKLSWGLLFIGAILPDIDYLFDWFANLEIHRTITHSLLFVIFIFFVTYLILKRYKKQNQAIFIAIGLLIHLVIDTLFAPKLLFFWPIGFSISFFSLSGPIMNWIDSIVKIETIDMGLGVLWLFYLFLRGKLKF